MKPPSDAAQKIPLPSREESGERTAHAGSTPEAVLAIDPGKDKCGVAIVARNGAVLWQRIAPPSEIVVLVRELLAGFSLFQIVLGNATTSRALREKLQHEFPQIEIAAVEEKNSTLEARELYWVQNPPRGWRRVLPLSAQAPPEPIDDFAAIVLARRFWQSRTDH
jgi:RNase H-fold protein (predicted Holliday junction resolvase)